MTDAFCLSRRALLAGGGAFVAWANMPAFARAEGRDPRLLVLVLRGALDGLSAVPAIGDKEFEQHRPQLIAPNGGPEAPLPLDGFFALSAAMPRLHALYRQKQALIVHACATPYRERSHFEGQNVLESGYGSPNAASDGWLNRAAVAMPRGERVNPIEGLAISANVPLILRGTAPVLTWTPPTLKVAPTDTVMRLHNLYSHVDPQLASVFGEGIDLDGMLAGADTNVDKSGMRAGEGAFLPVVEGATRLQGRLPRLLAALDVAIARIAERLAPVWKDTSVLVVTEFGRTVAQNGTDGTDHGNGTAAFLLGGRVKGGRVIADWPGLAPKDLFEGRDLLPTTDVRAVVKGVLRDQFGISPTELAEQVFPGSIGVKPMDGLVG
jgi:uncharacterized protein (DUF1501 family)